jgi:hypothetical protein
MSELSADRVESNAPFLKLSTSIRVSHPRDMLVSVRERLLREDREPPVPQANLHCGEFGTPRATANIQSPLPEVAARASELPGNRFLAVRSAPMRFSSMVARASAKAARVKAWPGGLRTISLGKNGLGRWANDIDKSASNNRKFNADKIGQRQTKKHVTRDGNLLLASSNSSSLFSAFSLQ